tara:strand:+ start:24141 stop:24869 length:729 start_codon:yes stop_codon:yes gene_type:complete
MLLNKNLDVKKIKKELQEARKEGHGYVSIDNYLDDKWAKRIYREFESIPWSCKWITRSGEHHTTGQHTLNTDEVGIVDWAAECADQGTEGGKTVFYYNFYERKPEITQYAVEDFLKEWCESGEINTFFNEVMDRDVQYPYVNVTQYLENHFSGEHDDGWTGEYGKRALAFFCHLTPEWRASWGGQTVFIDRDDWNKITRVIPPRWNKMHIIDTQFCPIHYVNHVTPWALRKRYSITGWFHEV